MARHLPTSEAAEQAFYDAMGEGHLDRMMDLWADTEGTVCSHPGRPRLVGLKAIRSSFEELFAGGGVRVTTDSLHCWRSADVAVHSLIERIAVESSSGIDVIEAVATNVFIRAPEGWQILVHQAGFSDDFDKDDEVNLEVLSAQIRHWIERGGEDDEDSDTQHPPRGLLH